MYLLRLCLWKMWVYGVLCCVKCSVGCLLFLLVVPSGVVVFWFLLVLHCLFFRGFMHTPWMPHAILLFVIALLVFAWGILRFNSQISWMPQAMLFFDCSLLYCISVLILYRTESLCLQIGGLSRLNSVSVLTLYTKESLCLHIGALNLCYKAFLCWLHIQKKESPPSKLEVFRVCIAFLYWFYIQNKAFPPDWRCFSLYSFSVLILYTKESNHSRLEASIFCIAFLDWFYIHKSALPPD